MRKELPFANLGAFSLLAQIRPLVERSLAASNACDEKILLFGRHDFVVVVLLPAGAEGEDLVDERQAHGLRSLNAEIFLFEKHGGRPAAERQKVDDHAELAVTLVATVDIKRLPDVAGVVRAELHVDAATVTLAVFLLDLRRE